jgi:poly-gamma-glutamate system protein
VSGWGFSRGRVNLAVLVLAAATAVGGFVASGLGTGTGEREYYAEQLRAAEIMQEATTAIKASRLASGIPIDRNLDPNETGLIGEEFTSITTSVGILEAKRTATNPDFAALIVRYFKEAGLGPGDVVAVGASGSFPSLILATLSAARALDLEPIIIYSVGASMYGATIPEFTFIDMLEAAREAGVIPYTLTAVSLGGEGDEGAGVLFEDGTEVMEAIAERAGVPVIREDSIAASIRKRLEVYEEHSRGRPIMCFVNVGGASANYGNTLASLEFPNGLVMRPPLLAAGPERGLVFEFAAAGIPVIHLLDVRGLALRNGIPVDPVPLPSLGEGRVYTTREYSRGRALAGLILSLGILAAGALGGGATGRGSAVRSPYG